MFEGLLNCCNYSATLDYGAERFAFGRLELEWCERKVLLGWSWSNKPKAVIIFSDVRALAGLRIDMSRFNQLLPVPDC